MYNDIIYFDIEVNGYPFPLVVNSSSQYEWITRARVLGIVLQINCSEIFSGFMCVPSLKIVVSNLSVSTKIYIYIYIYIFIYLYGG